MSPRMGKGFARGRVGYVEQGLVGVLTDSGPVRASIGGRLLSAVAAHPRNAPCPGDRVVLRHWPDQRTTLERLLPRRSELCCPDPAAPAQQHALCANVDMVVVLRARFAAPNSAGGVAHLLDLAGGSGADVELLTADPLPRLRTLAGRGRTVALLGCSARETADLIAALVGAPLLLRPARGRGMVRQELVPLPGGGGVIGLGSARCHHGDGRMCGGGEVGPDGR